MTPKKKQNTSIASIITGGMATWYFIIIFLTLCGLEIWFNHTSLVSSTFQFDPQTIILNLVLSLIAAVQGSIIMIDTRLADKKRDSILNHINTIVTRLDKLEKERNKNGNSSSN